MTLDDLKNLEIDTVLIENDMSEYLFKGITKNGKFVVIETLDDYDDGEYIALATSLLCNKEWKIKPSQNTVTLYEYFNSCGAIVFLDENYRFYDFIDNKIRKREEMHHQKILNGRTLTLDLDTWRLVE